MHIGSMTKEVKEGEKLSYIRLFISAHSAAV